MEIKIKTPGKVVLCAYALRFGKYFAVLVGSFILGIIVGLMQSSSPSVGFIIILITILPLVGVIVYDYFDMQSFAKKTRVTLSSNSVEIVSGNLTSNNNTHIPFGQIRDTSVDQPFLMKLFGLSVIHVTNESGVMTTIWGFLKEDTDAFARSLADKSQERIQVTPQRAA